MLVWISIGKVVVGALWWSQKNAEANDCLSEGTELWITTPPLAKGDTTTTWLSNNRMNLAAPFLCRFCGRITEESPALRFKNAMWRSSCRWPLTAMSA